MVEQKIYPSCSSLFINSVATEILQSVVWVHKFVFISNYKQMWLTMTIFFLSNNN